ncbi:hypothetical protein BJ875DRAFT_441415 [Amylocarpus encephaloides]|uniref:Uncharacterized protein n=1 Tax=Amylocarpus encephaloides TaxID=45428 RepID=A0A9P7YIT4_9HELO|nr:hypothetical protein BJ875DRAFT_441415 [Amylocarpus encephaloides]
MANVFPNIEKNDCSNRANGVFLKEITAFREALEYFDQSLSLAEDNLSRFHTSSVTANTLYEPGNIVEALAVANSALALALEKAVIPLDGSAPNTYYKSLYQVYYVVGNCLSATVDKDGAIKAFTKMREAVKDADHDIDDGENGVYSLSKIIDFLAEQEGWSCLTSEICSWTQSEFSNLMAADSGKSKSVIVFRKCYQDAIDAEDLDEEYSILLRYRLAYACWYVFDDEDSAWELLQEVLGNSEPGAAAGETRAKARQLTMDIISSKFQTTSTNWLAGAYLVVGQQKEAKEILNEAFHICIDALKDSVGSNDNCALVLLARILFFAGLEMGDRISLSNVFSITDHYNGGEEGVNNENDNNTSVEVETSTLQKGYQQSLSDTPSGEDASKSQDLDGSVKIIYSGYPIESPRRFWVPNDPLYMCVVCSNTFLCQACYEKRITQNQGQKSEYWKKVCGKDHKYLKGPIEDWGGVKNGVLKIGEEKLLFAHWLLLCPAPGTEPTNRKNNAKRKPHWGSTNNISSYISDPTLCYGLSAYKKYLEILGSVDAELTLVIAGKRRREDDSLEEHKLAVDIMNVLLEKEAGVIYLNEGTHRLILSNGVKFTIYASPYQPEYGDWVALYKTRVIKIVSTLQTKLYPEIIYDPIWSCQGCDYE